MNGYDDHIGYAKPYDEIECRHSNRKEINGVLTCLDCSFTYNEKTLEWEE